MTDRSTDAPFPGVSIVIPSYNGRRLLERFLPAVLEAAATYRRHSGAETEVIIVDDGSGDDTVTWLAERYAEAVRCLPHPVNRGFSPTCNAGFRAARFPVIWLLNNDIEPTPDALAPLVGHFADPEVFAVGCRAYRLAPDGSHSTDIDGAGRVAEIINGFWKVYRSFDLLPDYDRARHGPLHSMMASGGYAAFDAAKLRALGGFEELLSPFYWEDAELCYRAWKRGWTVRYEPDSLVYHQSSATIREEFEATTVNFVATRNRLTMHWIHLHDRWWWAHHLAMTVLLLAGDAVAGRFVHWKAVSAVWRRRREIWRRRREEQAAARRTDREIVAAVAEVTARPGIATYKNDAEYRAFRRAWERH